MAMTKALNFRPQIYPGPCPRPWTFPLPHVAWRKCCDDVIIVVDHISDLHIISS